MTSKQTKLVQSDSTTEKLSNPVLRRLIEKFNPKILAVVLDPREADLHRRSINLNSKVLTAGKLVDNNIPWWFNSNDPRMKNNRAKFMQSNQSNREEVAENRQSAESCQSNLSSPQSDEEWYQQQLQSDYQNQNKGQDQMITLQRSNAPQGQSVPKGVQFLSPKHVTRPDGFDVEIIKVTIDKPDNFGNPYVVYFSNGAEKFSKGFKSTSDLLASLVDMLGADETKWIGKKINVNKHSDDDGGVRLVFSLPANSPKRGR
jgi:hypothetical protein